MYWNGLLLLAFCYIYLRPAKPETPVIYLIQFLVFNFWTFDFLATKSSYHCENQLLLRPDFLRKV